jgi:chaperonin cofactor prefoldin
VGIIEKVKEDRKVFEKVGAAVIQITKEKLSRSS